MELGGFRTLTDEGRHDNIAPELVQGRFRARRLINQYNTHFPNDATPESLLEDRKDLLEQMFGKIGSRGYIEPPLHIDFGCNISIGDGFYSNFKYVQPHVFAYTPLLPYYPLYQPLTGRSLVILDCAIISIGNNVSFGPSVSIFAATHQTDVQTRHDGIGYGGSVTIGDDCWIGGNTTILPYVTIGRGCMIGAGSVVTRDVPEFSLAMGVPARVVRKVDAAPDA